MQKRASGASGLVYRSCLSDRRLLKEIQNGSYRIVDAAEFTRLQETILEMKGELLNKIEQYNAVRHDAAVSEKKKEILREKLFEGDHFWPHI